MHIGGIIRSPVCTITFFLSLTNMTALLVYATELCFIIQGWNCVTHLLEGFMLALVSLIWRLILIHGEPP